MAKRKKAQKENEAYELKPVKFKESTRRMLSMDPGGRNFGISLLAVNEKLQVKVVVNSLLTNPVDDLVAVNNASELFMQEIDRWVTLYKPQAMAAERFQPRGLLGPLAEKVSVMLGLLKGVNRSVPLKLVTAAVWKNEWHRRFPHLTLDEMYKLTRTTPHQLDSIFIGIYCLEQGLQVELDYDPLDIVKQAEATSAVRLINKRR